MQKFLALTTLVAAAHAAELLTTADIDSEEAKLNGIDNMKDTALNMGDDRDYYKKGHYTPDPAKARDDDDDHIQPLCSVKGAEGQVDSQGPSDQCCRTYDYVNFEGNHRDWCLYAVYDEATWMSTPEKQYDLDQLGWHNDISSWKCGNKVQIEMCRHEGDVSDWHDSMKAGPKKGLNCSSGHQLNHDMGQDSQTMDQLWIRPQGDKTDEEVCTATLYESPGCMGASFVIESNVLTKPRKFTDLTTEEKWRGSWTNYDSSFDNLLVNGTIKSVMFKGIEQTGKRCVVEMFQDIDFQSDSMTLKTLKGAGEACHPVPLIKPITDAIPHDRWTGNNFSDFDTANVSGVRSVQIRQEYFP